ncbi:PREDICTED: phenylalanine--tRNA ligase alpha subunit [Ficedula albicollis]|uniref:phenylalanine--tRNA ligase alpha subunit n=1 Tax=Ficedula albicollis TaxID=59894 RepID=UPI0003593EDA|nr:PREDICTED: phenylalanine--tRNA ligase alpha subunit [Ficedula albicollis]
MGVSSVQGCPFRAVPSPGVSPVPPQVPSVQDTVQEHLGQVRTGGAQAVPDRDRAELKRRKLLLEVTLKSFWIRKGSAFSTALARPETELTPEMIATGSWRRLPFKPYNL